MSKKIKTIGGSYKPLLLKTLLLVKNHCSGMEKPVATLTPAFWPFGVSFDARCTVATF